MRQKLNAGAEIDIPSVDELRKLMQEWKVDTARGARPVTISADGVADANGLVVMGGANTLTGGTLGPARSFWWAVTRLAVRVDSDPAAFSVFLDRVSPQSLVRDVDGSQNGYAAFSSHELMVGNSSNLVIAASSLTPGSRAFVSGSAIEIPEQLLWKWTTG